MKKNTKRRFYYVKSKMSCQKRQTSIRALRLETINNIQKAPLIIGGVFCMLSIKRETGYINVSG